MPDPKTRSAEAALTLANRALLRALRVRNHLSTKLRYAETQLHEARRRVRTLIAELAHPLPEQPPLCDNCGMPDGTNPQCFECDTSASRYARQIDAHQQNP